MKEDFRFAQAGISQWMTIAMKPGGMRIGLISGKCGWEGRYQHTLHAEFVLTHLPWTKWLPFHR